MFISVKRHEREKQELAGAARLTDAILKTSTQGLFLLDGKDKVLPPVSQALAALFRRQDFSNLTFQKLLAPLVTSKTLAAARNHIAGLQNPASVEAATLKASGAEYRNPLDQVDVRLTNPDGSYDTAQYSFEFDPIATLNEPRVWLVRVTDITGRIESAREWDDLRNQVQIQGDILRGVLRMGGAGFGSFVQHAEASLQTLSTVFKKPAREAEAFRDKLEEILHEVDRIRRDAAAFRLAALEGTARTFEDALQELRSRRVLSGSDFLPLAVKLDQLYGQFSLVKSLAADAGPGQEPDAPRSTNSGTLIMEAPRFIADAGPPPVSRARPAVPAGSLGSTLKSLTEHVALQHGKQVRLDCAGLEFIPPHYAAMIKNVAIQFIRNAITHGIEAPTAREAKGKAPRGTLRLEIRLTDDHFELLFEDDGRGLDPEQVRATAIARGVVTSEAAGRMRDREAIKLVFKSRYSTMDSAPGETHGAGMSLVRRHVHAAGGTIALASLPGHETRFKITLPLAAADVPAPADAPPRLSTPAQPHSE